VPERQAQRNAARRSCRRGEVRGRGPAPPQPCRR
jgi:hypothetical protein